MTYAAGQRFKTRSGAIARISYVYPFGPWRFIVCVIEAEPPYKISLCPDGKYYPRDEDHGLDLVSEMALEEAA